MTDIAMPVELAHQSLVALTPQEMGPVQAQLAEWCAAKVQALERELNELEEHRLIAQNNGWKLTSLTSNINRTARRVTYYAKVQAAVEAGYLVVPNFPVTLLAVRTKREKPLHATSTYGSSSEFNAKPEMLPAGTGRYVDERVNIRDESYMVPDDKGGTRKKDLWVSDSFDEPDFPWQLTKPVVLDATQRAMALKLFDTIGVVQNTSGRDPIMVGQLLDPRGNGRMVTFFIAWWLDTSTL